MQWTVTALFSAGSDSCTCWVTLSTWVVHTSLPTLSSFCRPLWAVSTTPCLTRPSVSASCQPSSTGLCAALRPLSMLFLVFLAVVADLLNPDFILPFWYQVVLENRLLNGCSSSLAAADLYLHATSSRTFRLMRWSNSLMFCVCSLPLSSDVKWCLVFLHMSQSLAVLFILLYWSRLFYGFLLSIIFCIFCDYFVQFPWIDPLLMTFKNWPFYITLHCITAVFFSCLHFLPHA